MQRQTRRRLLRTVGAVAVTGGITTGTSAQPSQDLRLFATEQLFGGCTEIATQGNYAYVTDYFGFGPTDVAVVDLRNPNAPRTVATLDTTGTFTWDLKVDGDRLYVASQTDGVGQPAPPLGSGDPSEIGVTVYDVSDPTAPAEVGFVPVPPFGSHNVYPDGDVLYLVRHFVQTDAGFDFVLEIWDVADPGTPERLATFAPPGLPHDVYVQDDRAYVPTFLGLHVLDVTDPSNPVEAGHWPSPTGGAHYAQPSPDGDVVYVGDEIFSPPFGGIHVLDASDVSSIERTAFVEPPETTVRGTAHNFDVTANRLHTSWYVGGVRVFDVADPGAPEEIAAYDPDGSSFWTAVQHRRFTLASDLARGSTALLHTDDGRRAPPAGNPTPVGVHGDGRPHTVQRHVGQQR